MVRLIPDLFTACTRPSACSAEIKDRFSMSWTPCSRENPTGFHLFRTWCPIYLTFRPVSHTSRSSNEGDCDDAEGTRGVGDGAERHRDFGLGVVGREPRRGAGGAARCG